MPLREPLAATLRLTRSARGLSQEDFHGEVEARHISNIEHAKNSVTLATLESLASVLEVDPLALLAAASCHEKKLTPKEFLKYLSVELAKLERLGVIDQLAGEFEEGRLIRAHPRFRSSLSNRSAVLECKAQGKSQKETAELLNLGKATVSRIWNLPPSS